MKNKFSIAMSLAVIMAMLVTSLALADEVYADGDNVAPVAQNPLNLGNICLGDTATGPVLLAIRRQANPSSDTVFANSSTVTISVASVSGSGLSAAMGVDNTVTLPANWVTAGTGTMSINTANSAISLNSTGLPLGAYTGSVQYDGTGTNALPPPATVTRNGNITVNATIVNCTPADTTPPVISYTVNGVFPSAPDGDNGWYKTNAFVDWTVSDPGSSVTTVGCVDTTINSDTAGTTLSCSATSAGGTSSDSVTIKRDATAPTGVSGVPNRAADSGTWYNHAVDVVFTGSDAMSGIAGCTTTNYSGPDGAGITVNGSCTDYAGNTSGSVTSGAFNYDGTAPTGVVLSITTGTLGSNGWYTSDVTVHTSSDPDLSGVTCTADQYQTAETAGAAFNGSCTDGAGNTANAAQLTVKLDKTGPSASLAVTAGTAGANGWYTSDVTVSTSGSDDISGPVSCTANQFQTTETAGAVFNGSCTNDAGLATNAASLSVKLDKSAPSAALSVTAGTAGTNGWYTSDVTVSTTGSDSISSPVTCSGEQYQTTETTGADFNGSCTNDAGLSTNAASLSVKLDKTGPSASLSAVGTLGNNGWYVSDVTIQTAGTDTVSDPTTCTADQFQMTDTAGATFNGSCTNEAGLSTNADALTIKRDATAPTSLSFIGGPAAGGSYYFGSVPSVSTCTADGALSGLASCGVSGHGTTVGMHTMTATATDNAGNVGTATQSYTVLAWTINGFYQPVDMGRLNIAKGGSTVPLKFEVFAGTTELTNINIVSTFVQALACGTGTLTDDIENYATGGTSLRYDATGGQFIFNWQTPRLAGNCYRVTLTTLDGTSISADFKLK